jgi:hypothetical protein
MTGCISSIFYISCIKVRVVEISGTCTLIYELIDVTRTDYMWGANTIPSRFRRLGELYKCF